MYYLFVTFIQVLFQLLLFMYYYFSTFIKVLLLLIYYYFSTFIQDRAVIPMFLVQSSILKVKYNVQKLLFDYFYLTIMIHVMVNKRKYFFSYSRPNHNYSQLFSCCHKNKSDFFKAIASIVHSFCRLFYAA